MYGDDDLLALSGLQHIAYCERQWALIHIDQVWEESADTVRGEHFHERVDIEGYTSRNGIRAERSVRVVSRRLGIYGIADIVEFGRDGIMPVEYKVGKPKMEDWDRLQVTAQALCLEEMEGVRIDTGALFYGETRRRERFEITTKLRSSVEELSDRMHRLFQRGCLPPAIAGGKCRRCSLHDACLPELAGSDVGAYWDSFGDDTRGRR